MDFNTPKDDNNVNKKMENLLDEQKKSADAAGTPVKEIPNTNPSSATSGPSTLDKPIIKSFTQIMESLDDAEKFLESDPEEDDISNTEINPSEINTDELLDELNKLYTPVLVNQSFEKDIAGKTAAALESADVLTERSVVQFDDETRYAQLVAVCAKLIAKQKNSEAWQMYKKAAVLKQKAGLEIQEQEHDAAKQLAQKYLVKVSTTNNSSVARNAATDLLPQTNKND